MWRLQILSPQSMLPPRHLGKLHLQKACNQITKNHVSLSGTPLLPVGFEFDIIHTPNTNTARIVPRNYQGYDGRIQLEISATNKITSAQNDLPVDTSILPLSGTNERTMQFSLSPEVVSISSRYDRRTNSIEWTTTFNENIDVSNLTLPDDFPISFTPPIHELHRIPITRTDTPNAENSQRIWTTRQTLPPLYAGIVRLDVRKQTGNITDQSNTNTPFASTNNALKPLAPTPDGRIVAVGNIAPRLVSVVRDDIQGSNTNAEGVVRGRFTQWTFTFSEPVQDFTADNVQLQFVNSNGTPDNITNSLAQFSKSEPTRNTQKPNEYEYTFNLELTRGFPDEKLLEVTIKANNNIRDVNGTPLPLASVTVASSPVSMDPAIQLLAINRGTPINENVTNLEEVIWNLEFTEIPYTGNQTTPLNDSSFNILLNDQIYNNAGHTIGAREHRSRFIYPVTFNNFNSLDGNIKLALNDNNPIVDDIDTPRDTAETPTPNNTAFIFKNGPIATITRTATAAANRETKVYDVDDAAAIVGLKNPSLTWDIRYNETVEFAANAYQVRIANNNPFTGDANPIIIEENNQHHRVTVQNFGNFNGNLHLFIDPAIITDKATSNNELDNGNTRGSSRFNVDTQPPQLLRITRSTQSGGATNSTTNNNNLHWKMEFDEPVRGLTIDKFRLIDIGNNANTPVNAIINETRIDPDNPNNWIVTTTVKEVFNGRKQIRIILEDNHNIIDKTTGENRLANATPQNGSSPFTLNVAPRVESYERMSPPNNRDARGLNQAIWKINFSDSIRNIGPEDFTITAENNANIPFEVDHAQPQDTFVTVTADIRNQNETIITLGLANSPSINDIDESVSLPLVNTTPLNADNNNYRIGPAPSIALARTTTFNVNPISVNEVTWNMTFSEDVNTFDETNLSIIANPQQSFNGTIAVNPVGTEFSKRNVVVSGINNYDGDIRLVLNDNNNLTLRDGNNTPFTGTIENTQSVNNNFLIDNVNPRVTRIERMGDLNAAVDQASVQWNVSFDEDVTLDENAYSVLGAPSSIQTNITQFDDDTHSIVVTNFESFDGEITLEISEPNRLLDNAEPQNGLVNTEPINLNENNFFINNSPQLNQIIRDSQHTNGNAIGTEIRWRLIFSEEIDTLEIADLTIVTQSNLNVQPVINTPIQATPNSNEWIVNVTVLATYQGDANLQLQLVDGSGIFDVSANANQLINGNPTGENIQNFVLDVPPRIARYNKTTQGTGRLIEPAELQWEVVFTENVRDVEDIDFQANNASVLNVVHTDDTNVATVTFNNIDQDFDGNVVIELANNAVINDLSSQDIGNKDEVDDSNNSYLIGYRPTFNLTRDTQYANPPNNNGEVRWKIAFNKPIIRPLPSDFVVVSAPSVQNGATIANATPTISNASGEENTFILTATGHTQYDGEITLELSSSHNIRDNNGTELTQNITVNDNFLVDNKQPSVNSIAAGAYSFNQDSVSWDVIFSEDVVLEENDVTINGTPTDNSKSNIAIDVGDITVTRK